MFRKLAHFTSELVGSPKAFFFALSVVILWGFSGQFFDYSDTWQLVINTGTTIVTFLMIFLVQNTQNRDARAIHLKLDELIRSLEEARNDLLDIEDEPDQRLSDLQQEFKELSHHDTSNTSKK
jgi:low affinity Fe/Cu permease